MPDSTQSHDVLCEILRVLERIEARLDGHEQRVRQLESSSTLLKLPKDGAKDDDVVENMTSSMTSTKLATAATSIENLASDQFKAMPRIPYGDWSIDQFIRTMPQDIYAEWGASHTHLERFYSLTNVAPDLRRRLGSSWDMPDDTRFPLKFLKSNVLKSHITGIGPHIDTFSRAKQRIEREMSQVCDFDDALRKHPGNDFVVVDFDPQNNSRMYRLGQPAIGPDIYVDAVDAPRAPWSRLILYQGATTGDSIDRDSRRPEIPYFTRTDRIIGVWDHLFYHLSLKNRSATTNPYFSKWTGFHTTFYEIVETTEMKNKEIWKHGPLYEHPLGWHFRKCAFTLYSPASSESASVPEGSQSEDSGRFWTLLVLSPSGFFNDHNIWYPTKTAEIGFNASQVVVDPLGKLTQLGAELKFIGQGLEKISERWSDFQAYFDYMLDSGNSLMQPTEHDNLLFDDGAFSRSRKYFWAIDCLAEFDNSITDNLVQWEQYLVARIDPIADSMSEPDRRRLQQVKRQHGILQNQRDTFRQKLAAIKALRDALFNASAVIESRASTRLGENVKLLTFVSIFFLPLSFISSLWSINDSFPRTTLIYTIIIVALTTYLIMFNINSLVALAGRTYAAHKRGLVWAMKHDGGMHSTVWRERGRRFEVFRPRAQYHERLQPSEWLVPFYAVLHPLVALGWTGTGSGGGGGGVEGEERAEWWWRMGRSLSWSRFLLRGRGTADAGGGDGKGGRGKGVTPKAARTDEGWVL